MIAGHFGLAAAVKSRAPAVPLWALMLATQWLDVVFVPLLVAKVEGLTPIAGSAGGYGDVIIHADYTHSLIGALLLSGVFGVLLGWRYGRTEGLVLAGVAFSHWLLDLVVHHADMPVLPGEKGGVHFGFGLWSSPFGSIAVEAALVLLGSLLYWRAALRVAGHAQPVQKQANIAALAVLSIGSLTLALNAFGM